MSNSSNQAVVEPLSVLLASSYTLYLKTQNYHWNVTGPNFTTLHLLFETQYTDLAGAVDLIAERIRALGAHAPGSFTEFAKLSSVKEDTSQPNAKAMITALLADQELVVENAKAVARAAEANGDLGSADLATTRLEQHEKNAWMLRSHLE